MKDPPPQVSLSCKAGRAKQLKWLHLIEEEDALLGHIRDCVFGEVTHSLHQALPKHLVLHLLVLKGLCALHTRHKDMNKERHACHKRRGERWHTSESRRSALDEWSCLRKMRVWARTSSRSCWTWSGSMKGRTRTVP